MGTRSFTLVVFGASGFTGQYVTEEVVRTLQRMEPERKFTWAVAGRSEAKLDEVLNQATKFTGIDVRNTAKILADSTDQDSLLAMARQAHVVLNCAGPYREYGESVVKACITGGADHLDLSAERLYLEGVQLRQHSAAVEAGVYIIGGCGFDSIPADCGTVWLAQHFDGDLNSVEEYLEVANQGAEKAKVHFGTFKSVIYGLAHARELGPLRQQLFREKLPTPEHKVKGRGLMHNGDVIGGGWCVPFPGSDVSIMERTQRFMWAQHGEAPAQIKAYAKIGGWFRTFFLLLGAAFFGAMTQIRPGRYLLERFPGFFSGGYVSHKGPSREGAAAIKFRVTLVGRGWATKEQQQQHHDNPPDTTLVVKCEGRNPGYGATPKCMIQAALALIYERDKIPSNGGVLTPGAAFAHTSLVDRLNQIGVTFTVVRP